MNRLGLVFLTFLLCLPVLAQPIQEKQEAEGDEEAISLYKGLPDLEAFEGLLERFISLHGSNDALTCDLIFLEERLEWLFQWVSRRKEVMGPQGISTGSVYPRWTILKEYLAKELTYRVWRKLPLGRDCRMARDDAGIPRKIALRNVGTMERYLVNVLVNGLEVNTSPEK